MQNPFVSKHFGAIDLHNGAQEIFEFGRIEGPIGFIHKTFDIIVMMMVVRMTAAFARCMVVTAAGCVRVPMIVMSVITMGAVFMAVFMTVLVLIGAQKIGVDFELGVEVETPQIEHFGQIDFAKMHRALGCTRVHVLETVLQIVQLR